MAIAASVLGLALLIPQFFLPGFNQVENPNGLYSAAIGEQSSLKLADGSSVQLNTNSQIKVEYTEHHRNIHLIQGEAHFTVAKNKDRPFRVYAGEGRVEAIGTAFTVYLREWDVEVLVTEGEIELAAQAPTEERESIPGVEGLGGKVPEFYLAIPVERLGSLEAGEGATIIVSQRGDGKSTPIAPKLESMDSKTRTRRDSWRTGLVLFAGDSLEDVVREISRYSPVSIEIVDPVLKKIRIGGQFRVGDIESMFDVLETNFDLEVTLLSNRHVQISAPTKDKDKDKGNDL